MKYWMCLVLLGTIACGSSQKPDNTYKTGDERPIVDDKYSLTADRKALEEVRGQVPPEKKKENDELAFILGLMSEVKRPPSEIRSQFDSVLRKKREVFDTDLKKERETFTKEERKKREEFLKSQQKARDEKKNVKMSREERNEFFKELDGKRNEFFSVEREKRNDFESDVRERRKNFEDYARQKQNEFTQELRAYSKRYEDMRKEREKAKSQPATTSPGASFQTPGSSRTLTAQIPPEGNEAAELERELREIMARPGTPLEAGQ